MIRQHRIRRGAIIAFAVAPVLTTLGVHPAIAATPMQTFNDSILRTIHVNTTTALPLDGPPINGFVPQVVVGLTDEQTPNDQTFGAVNSSSPGGSSLPVSGPAYYTVATVDTGSQSDLISYNDAQIFNLDSAGRAGAYTALIAGASGTETVDISDSLGVYATGFANASSNGAAISVTPGTMVGQKNVSILTSEPGSQLPNLLGAPMMAQYQTVIRNSQPHTLTVGSTTYATPQVSFQALDTAYPANYSRLTFDVQSPSGVTAQPVFIPSLDNFENLDDNPSTPTFWGSFLANATAAKGSNSSGSQQFLFDTGAQVTVLSEDTAAACGIYSAGTNPTPPDFTVQVQGAGGTEEEPGYYIDSLRVLTNGGPIVWTHVPVVVLDLPDPRDGVGYVPGVLGMNLFTDRDLIINGGLNDPSVAISPEQQWFVDASGNWSGGSNWALGVPAGEDTEVGFLSRITAPQTVTVDQNYTVGSLQFDNANRYTINGPATLTLQSSDGVSAIHVISGSHTINAPMTFANDTVLQVDQPSSTLTINSSVSAAGVAIDKEGSGTAEMANIRCGALMVGGGTLRVLQNGSASGTSVVTGLSISGGGNLDLKDNALIVKGPSSAGSADLGTWNGTAYTGITGQVASGRNGGTWNGSGIITSMSAAASPSILTTLGVATAAQIGRAGATFAGASVSGDDVLVAYTYAGDANLDGRINGDDYFAIDSHINIAGESGYANGDFNYDGKINGDDYFLIDSNINVQGLILGHSGAFALAITPVPEPAGFAVVLLAFFAITPRRRRSIRFP